MITSPSRKKSTPSAANAKIFEHLKTIQSPGFGSVRVKTPLDR